MPDPDDDRLPIFDEVAGRLLLTHYLPAAPDPPTGRIPPTVAPPDEETPPVPQQPPHVQTSHPQRKLGRQPKHTDEAAHPRLKLGAYLRTAAIADVPDVVDYSGAVADWGMMRNDTLGDCTAAAAGHAEELWTTYGGAPWTPTDDDVLAFYSGSTGYDPRDPSTDQGGIMQDVLAYWRKTGIAGRTLEGFFQVDPSNADELRAALYLFGCVNIGMDFPAFAMDQNLAGQPWDIPKSRRADTRIEGGHDVLLVAMTRSGNYTVVTWGQLQVVTPAFWNRYMAGRDGEAWAMAEQDWIGPDNQAPNALDVAALNADFTALTGEPGPFTVTGPPPEPAPEPEPEPEPAPEPTPAPEPPDDPEPDTWDQLVARLDALLAQIRAFLAGTRGTWH